jgi:hypothetical protein
MKKKSTLDQPDAQFLATANNINEECTQHSSEWGLEPTRLAQLNTLTIAANAAYAANSNPATRNHISTVNKNTAFDDLKEFLRPYINTLEGNLSVPDAALEIMGLRPRVRHAPQVLPPPKDKPGITTTSQHNEITVYASRAEHGHPTDSVTDSKYAGIKVRWRFVGETEYHYEVTTRLQYTIHFNQTDKTKLVEIAAAWINPRLEPGPWSDDITEVIV